MKSHPQALLQQAMRLHQSGQIQQAMRICTQILKKSPDYPDALHLLGLGHHQLGNAEKAIEYINRAIGIAPKEPALHNNLGEIHRLNGELSSAQKCYEKALQLQPDHVSAHNNLGIVLSELGRHEDAVNRYQRSLSINPDFGPALKNLANTLVESGKLDEAIRHYRAAIRLNPSDAELYNNLGTALAEQRQFNEANLAFQKAIGLNPEYSAAHSNLCFTLNYASELSLADYFKAHRNWAAMVESSRSQFQHNLELFNKNRRIRIGYVSADLRSHSVSYFFEILLKHHNPDAVDVYCYSDVKAPDKVTHRLQSLCPSWTSIVGQSDEEVARKIQKDRVQVLVDLAGHSAANRLPLFALKPAPVQVSWLGYPGTTGLKRIDYRFTDEIADPVGDSEAFHSEELWRLPRGFLCFQGEPESPSPAAKTASDQICFGSFNNLSKTNHNVVQVWANILNALPRASLYLKSRQLADASIRQHIQREFATAGIEPQRIELQGRVNHRNHHLELYDKVDIALDTFPYNGTTTTCEALLMNVPVVTLRGDRHASRVGASILTQIGLTELIADSTDEYIELALKLAGDSDYRTDLSNGLRQRLQSSDLCNGPQFAQDVETAYQSMWQRYADGKFIS
jgi:predicted O-linked N-acetylglucosamine transferase (SPINDLY family)